MMSEPTAIDLLQSLTPDHQKQVINLITVLKAREQQEPSIHEKNAWEADPFFGIWADRIDPQEDSTQWVRQLRQEQWSRS